MKLSYFLIAFAFFLGCKSVPLSGRKQLNLLPNSQMHTLSYDQYSQMMSQSNVVTGTEDSRMIKEIGANIKGAVEQYLKDNNKLDLIEGYDWEFNLIESDQINAFCMPGGKVAFYTGILPICANEDGIAAVMGHEIAHAIARHGNERMSQQMVQQMGGVALSVALSQKPEQTQQLFMSAYGLGSQVGVLLPYSRLHESEADHLGLIFMAMAGYNPEEAPELWKRMAAQSQGTPPEFLSTHPSHDTRIKNLNKWMSEAKQYYKE